MLNKKILESVSVGLLALLLTVGSMFGGTVAKSAETTECLQNDVNVTAEITDDNITVEKEEATVTAATEETQEVVVELTEEEKEWQNKLMPNIEGSSLNVRAEANAESDLVGKMEAGDVAEIVEDGTEWIKIKSGNVEGYVSRQYCYVGLDALEYAKANIGYVAKATTSVRVRSEASTESSVVKSLSEGDKVVVASDATAVDGWVAVTVKEKTCYVSADYVEVSMDLGKALTVEEIREIEAAKKKKASSSSSSSSGNSGYSSSNITQGDALSYSQEDLDLMAALIYCEVGGSDWDSMLAIASTICNEVKSSSFPDSIEGVIYYRRSWGPAHSGKLARVLANGSATQGCYDAAVTALSGVDNVGGRTCSNSASSGINGLVIGTEVFYYGD